MAPRDARQLIASLPKLGEGGERFVTPANASRVKDLVSPGVYYKVQHGMTMKIVPTERVDWPPPYKEATEKYSAQVSLAPDRRCAYRKRDPA